MNVVIADDSSMPRDVLRQVLMTGGFNVVAACASGEEAVEACAQFSPDAVILDISMPGKYQGNEAAHVIRAADPNVRIVLASSAGQDAIRKPLEAQGFKFVSKPYNKDQFLRALREVLR